MGVNSIIRRGIFLCLIVIVLLASTSIQAYAEGSTNFNQSPAFNENFNRVKDNWTEYGGTWSIRNDTYNVNSGLGYKSIINGNNYSDFVYEADVCAGTSANSGLIFRVKNPSVGVDAYTGYFAGIDARNNGIVLGKANNNWTGLGWYPTQITPGIKYHIKIVANGSSINIYLTDMNTPKISVTDSSYISGTIGIRTSGGDASFDNIFVKNDLDNTVYSEDFNITYENWAEYGGNWTIQNGIYCVSSGLGYKSILNNTDFSNISYEADVQVQGSGNAGLVFRVNNPSVGIDSYSGYYVGIDSINNGIVIGRANGNYTGLGCYLTPIKIGTIYHIKIEAIDSTLKVYLDDMSTPKINITDSSFASGAIGVRAHRTQANFDNISIKTASISGNPNFVAAQDPVQTPQEQLVAEPIDTASGAHIIERSLLDVTGTEKLSFDVRYNSLLLKDGPLGKGWEYPYQTYLETQANGNVLVHWTTNRLNTFVLTGGSYVSTDQATKYDKLTKNADGSYTLKRKDHSILEFNASGKLTQLKNGFGQTLVMSYDSSSRLAQIEEPVSGQIFTLDYNSQGLISSITDNANRTITLTYNQNHNLTGITDSRGTITYTYDSIGRILTGTDFTGTIVFTDTYDQLGRVITQKDSLNHQTAFNYDESTLPGKLITNVTDRNGNTKSFTFDAKYELLSVKDESANVKQYTYDSNSNRVSSKDENGNTTTYTYDARGNLLTLTDPLGHITKFTYDANDILLTTENALSEKVSNTYDTNGNILTSTDPLSNTTTYTYNANGQVLTKFVPNSGTTTFVYQNGMLQASTDPLNQTTTFGYDAVGRMITKTDSDGNITTYDYDFAGNTLAVTDPLGYKTSYTYDANGNKLTATDAQGNVTNYVYNTNGKLVTITDPKGHKTSYVYDNEERVVKTTVYDGTNEITTVTTYDPTGRVLSVQDPTGNLTSYTYDQKGNVLTRTEPGKGTTTYTYDQNGKVLTETDAANNTTTYAYNNAGRLITKTNALGKTTTYTYDADGHITKVTDPLGHSVSYTYDNQGNKLTETDGNSNVTSYSYDANGKLISVTDSLNHKTQYQYDAEGHMTKVTDAKGNATTLTYDAAGRLIATTDALGHTVTTQYGKTGHVVGITDALGHKIAATTYDATGKPLTVTDALGNVTTSSYDSLNRLVTIIDALNHKTVLSYDQLSRVVSVVDPLQGQSTQTFDAGGNIKTTVDPNDNETVYDYDLMGRLIQETTKIGSSKTYSYNALNLKSEQTNGRGQATHYQYDDAGRLISLTDPAGTVSYTYDNNGNVLTITDRTGTITRNYDKLNRVTKYTDNEGNMIRYAYDEVGNLTTLTYPGGKVVQYDYNAVNQLIRVTDWDNRVTQYEYDANGRLTKTERPDGSVQTMRYNAAGWLTQQKDVDKNGETINQYDYTYDQVGKVTSEKSAKEQPPYAGPNATMTYAESNQLATYNGQAVQYDADGNMTSGPLMGSTANFSYDARNRLISAGNTSYGYDAENNRIAVITDGQQTRYVINPQAKLSQLLIKTDSQGKKTYYIYGLGLIGQEEADGTYKSYHFDNRGSTTALTDSQGVVTDTFAYAPFGELIQRTGTTDTPFLYNGRDGVMTDGNGLYYMRARYYNPDIKRFINQDVLQGSINNGQSMNRYAYVNGNPVSQVDPFGLCAESTNSNSLIHLILGGLSFIPGLNVVTSLADSGFYLMEGDYVNASIAMACIIPFAKEGVLGIKVADEVVDIGKLAEGVGKAIATKSGFTLTQHAIDQLGEARFGGKLSVDRLDELMHAKDSIRVIDNRTGNVNVYVQSEFSSSSLMRITVPNDGKRIVSIGFEPLKRIEKFINSGDFVPLN